VEKLHYPYQRWCTKGPQHFAKFLLTHDMARGNQETKVWGYLTGNTTPEKRREYLAQRQIASTTDNDIVAFGYGR
jgi:hypothetical protein